MKSKIQIMFYTLLVLLAGFACTHTTKQHYQKIKSVSLELSYVPSKWGYFYEKGNLYIYTQGYPTHKKIDIISQNGKVVNSIDLSTLKLKTDRIKTEIKSWDSCFVLASEQNELFLINSKSKKTQKISLDSLVYQKTEYSKKRCSYISLSAFGDMVSGKSVIFNTTIIDTSYHQPENYYQARLYENMQVRKNPQLIYIKNVFDTTCKVITEPTWIGKTIREENEDFNITPKFAFLENKIIFWFSHNRHIYFLNPDNLTFERKTPVFSDYTELEYPRPKLTQKQPDKPYVLYALYKGGILYVHQDKNKYFICVRHEIPPPEKADLLAMPDEFDVSYSVIIYDNQWKKQKEILLPAQEKFISFLPNGQFVTQSKSKNPRNITLNFYQWTE
jgi:hypothetical protein